MGSRRSRDFVTIITSGECLVIPRELSKNPKFHLVKCVIYYRLLGGHIMDQVIVDRFDRLPLAVQERIEKIILLLLDAAEGRDFLMLQQAQEPRPSPELPEPVP